MTQFHRWNIEIVLYMDNSVVLPFNFTHIIEYIKQFSIFLDKLDIYWNLFLSKIVFFIVISLIYFITHSNIPVFLCYSLFISAHIFSFLILLYLHFLISISRINCFLLFFPCLSHSVSFFWPPFVSYKHFSLI